MKETLLLKLLIAAILVLAGCGSPSEEKIKQETDTPPSVQEEAVAHKNQIITIDAKQLSVMKIEYQQISSGIIDYTITAPGVVYPAPENIAYVSAPISGRVVSINAHEGDFVRKGQLLLEIESLEYGTLVAELMQTKAELDYQESQLDRIRKLTERKISTVSELEKANAEYSKASTNFKAAISKMMAIGVQSTQIDKILSGKDADTHLKIYAPISGSIDKHLVDLGQAVNSLENLMTVIDLSRVLVKGYVAPEEAHFIKPGTKVNILHKLSDGKIHDVPITSINPALDENNKSVVLNILTKTHNNFPKPGLNVRLEIKITTSVPMIKVPASAISYEGNLPTVFVKISEYKFEKRFVDIYKNVDKYAIINSGLKEGETIATTQIFSLKALGRFEQFAE